MRLKPRSRRGFTTIELLIVIAALAAAAAVAWPRIVRGFELGAVHNMKADIHALASLEAAKWEESKTYADPEALLQAGTWSLGRGVRIDSTARAGERLYVRLAHSGTGKRCSIDLSYEDRAAENVTRCWGGSGGAPEGTSALGVDFQVSDASTGMVASTYTSGSTLLFSPSLTEADRAAGFTWQFSAAPTTQGTGAPAPLERTFGVTGEVTVSLTVDDRHGGEATVSKRVRLVDPGAVRPTAQFTFTPDGADPGTRIAFDGRLSSHPRGYDKLQVFAWEMGDGRTEVGDEAAHTYTAPGDYPVTLIVTDASGSADTTQALVRVRTSGFAPDFDWNPATPAVGTAVAFRADTLRVGSGGSYVFNFGDGGMAAGQAPTHTFSAEGTVPVTLTATNALGATRTVTKAITVLPSPGPGPAAQFTCSATGLSVLLDATTSTDGGAGPLQYAFDFGDFTSASGPTVRHSYTAPGSYAVRLTVRNATGRQATSTRTCAVSDDAAAPWADFTAAPTELTVRFDASASNGGRASDGSAIAVCDVRWDFGDGATGRGATPIHTYATGGDYAVRATVLSCSGESANAVRVVQINRAPVAAFVFNPGGPQVGQPVSFDATSSSDPDGQALTYTWTFGDGSTPEAGATTSHTYPRGGSFTVSLTVTDVGGATHTTTRTVVVNTPPAAAFTVTPATPQAGQAVLFDGSTSSDADGDALSYSWSYGTGGAATGSGVTSSYTYPASGSFTVRLTVSDARGGEASVTRMVSVNGAPSASLTADGSAGPITVEVGQAISFAAAGIDPDGDAVDLALAFGDGTTAAGASQQKAYSSAGTFSAWASATDVYGASATSNVVVVTVLDNRCLDGGARNYGQLLPCRYNSAPSVTLAVNGTTRPISAAVGEAVSITASGSDPDGDGLSFIVNFGDGTSGTGQSHSKAYDAPGTFYVQASATDTFGGSASSNLVQISVASATCQDPGAENSGQPLPCWYLQSPTITGPANQTDWTVGEQRGFTYTLRNPNPAGRSYCLRIQSSNNGVVGSVGGDGPDACGIWIAGNASITFGPHALVANGSGSAVETALVYDQSRPDRQGSMSFENQVPMRTCTDPGAKNYGGLLPCTYNRPPVVSFEMEQGHNLCHKVIYTASATASDPDGWVASYAWKVVWNGVTYGSVSGDGTPAVRFEGPTSKEVQVSLTVTDNEGQQATASTSFTAAAPICPEP